MNTKMDMVDWLLVTGLVVVCAYFLNGCGYALVRIPSAGERVSITTEQRVQSAFETAVETVEPSHLGYVRRLRRE